MWKSVFYLTEILKVGLLESNDGVNAVVVFLI